MAVTLPEFDFASLQSMANAFFYGNASKGGQGAVMGKLGEFPFYMHRNDFKQIAHSLKADFSSYKPIKGLEVIGDSGGTGRTIRLNGVLVAEGVEELDPLEFLLKERKPLRFTTLTNDFHVVITNLDKVESNFYIDGTARVQRYNISLKEIYGEIV